MATLRHGGRLLGGVIVLACTVGPTVLAWWDAASPAALRTTFALLLFSLASSNIGRDVPGLPYDYYD